MKKKFKKVLATKNVIKDKMIGRVDMLDSVFFEKIEKKLRLKESLIVFFSTINTLFKVA